VTKIQIMRPNSMSKYCSVLDEFGLDSSMLNNLMEGFVFTVSKGKTICDLYALDRILLVKYLHSIVLQDSPLSVWINMCRICC